MELFAISCTTCGARLKVRSMAAIGQILACPKCQSMVEIAPPEDWSPPATPAAAAAPAKGAPRGKLDQTGTKPAKQSPESEIETVRSGNSAARSTAGAAAGPSDSDFAAPTAVPATSEAVAAEAEPALPAAVGVSPLERAWKRGLAGAVAAAAVAIIAFAALGPESGEEKSPALAESATATRPTDGDQPGQIDKKTIATKAMENPQPTAGNAHDLEPSKSNAANAAKPTLPQASPAPIQPVQSVAASEPDETSPSNDAGKAAEDSEGKPATTNVAAPSDSVSTPERQDGAETIDDKTISALAADRSNSEPVAELTSELSPADQNAVARLEERLAAIDFQQAKLSDLVEFLARMANLTIEFDQASLVAAGVKPEAQVSVKQTHTNVARVLEAALGKLGLKYEIREGQVVIVTRPDPGERRPRGGPQDSAPPKRTDEPDEQSDDASDSAPSPKSDLRLPAAKP